jgi:hypothetical protein
MSNELNHLVQQVSIGLFLSDLSQCHSPSGSFPGAPGKFEVVANPTLPRLPMTAPSGAIRRHW